MSAAVDLGRVGVIGPGRVGTAVALALRDAGAPVVAVAGRGEASLRRFGALLPDVPVHSAHEVARAVDTVMLTVADDDLATLVRTLVRDGGIAAGSRWVHTAGRHGLSVLRPAALAGARTAACHPAQTFPTPEAGHAALEDCAWAVTASPPDRRWADALVRLLGGEPVAVADAARVRYHTALALASNATGAVTALARDLLLAAGVADPAALLTPLAEHSVRNAAIEGAAAITGPVRRGDGETVRAHLDDLRLALPEAVPAYATLARLILSYARRAGLDDQAAADVRAALGEE